MARKTYRRKEARKHQRGGGCGCGGSSVLGFPQTGGEMNSIIGSPSNSRNSKNDTIPGMGRNSGMGMNSGMTNYGMGMNPTMPPTNMGMNSTTPPTNMGMNSTMPPMTNSGMPTNSGMGRNSGMGMNSTMPTNSGMGMNSTMPPTNSSMPSTFGFNSGNTSGGFLGLFNSPSQQTSSQQVMPQQRAMNSTVTPQSVVNSPSTSSSTSEIHNRMAELERRLGKLETGGGFFGGSKGKKRKTKRTRKHR